MRRDIADLRERMAKLEGSVEVLSNFLIDQGAAQRTGGPDLSAPGGQPHPSIRAGP